MAYPVLAASNTWWKPNVSSVTRASITEIEIMDSYTPDASVTVTDSWDASAAKDGSVMCYVIGAKLIIAGNGSGEIFVNEDGSYLFSDAYETSNWFTNLALIDGIPLLNTSMATTLSNCFYSIGKVKRIDVSSWDTSSCKNMQSMFGYCAELTTAILGNIDTSKVESMATMFAGCSKLPSVDMSLLDTSNVTTMVAMFVQCYALKTLDLSVFNTSKVTNMASMFYYCISLESLNLQNFNMSKVEDMSLMFAYCSKLKTITISNWSVSSCKNMLQMFLSCSSLSNLNTSGWDVSLVTNMGGMFYSCSSLGEIDVSSWDVSNVTNFDHFAAHANLRRKGIENWKTPSATNMNAFFHNCAEEELDLSGFDVSKNQFFCQMFENSPNLKRIKGLDKWNTSAGLGFDGVFERCSKLEEVDLSSFDTTKAKNNVSVPGSSHKTATLQNMFLSCNNLKKVAVGPNFAVNGNGSNTTAANKAILPTPSADYIEGADGNWYTFNGDSYAPNAMKDKTAETYYASPSMVFDVDVIVKNGSLIDTAKAIREKNGATTHYTPAQFGAAIRAL